MTPPVPDLKGTVSPAAAATAPSREAPARAAGIPRRRLLRYGLAACGVGLASAGGIWFGMPMLKRGKLPPTSTQQFDLVTVDERGDPNPQQSETIDVFELPVGDATMEFSVIPSGGFQIGSPDSEILRRPNEGPQQFVELKSFALSPHHDHAGAMGCFGGSRPRHDRTDARALPVFLPRRRPAGRDRELESRERILPASVAPIGPAHPPPDRGGMGIFLPRQDDVAFPLRPDHHARPRELLRARRCRGRGERRQGYFQPDL